MNQQGIDEIEDAPQGEDALRDWERSEWFQEWLHCHGHEAEPVES